MLIQRRTALNLLIVLVSALRRPTCITVTVVQALILESGQRISPLQPAPQPPLVPVIGDTELTAPKPAKVALLELPAVEEWATSENLNERHLKTLYRVLLQPKQIPGDDYSLYDRLVGYDFPKSAASSLLLHNNLHKFEECTSQVVSVSPSQRGCKLAIQFDGEDGPVVETVLIRHVNAKDNFGSTASSAKVNSYTVCVSCQRGCSRACTFCETGTMGLRGNLSSGQILEQVWHAEKYLQKQNHGDGYKEDSACYVRNVVFMGMGDALDAYTSVHEACRGLTHQCLFGLAAKQITISTVGAAPEKIRDLANDIPGVSLALSLHGATQSLREELIPSARGIKGSSLNDLAAALDYYSQKTGRGVMIEYILIQNVNDSIEAADDLAEFCLERQHNQQVRAEQK